jgi:hypothetical protein
MTVRALTSSGGIVTSGLHFISGQQEIGQTIVTRLKLFYGEYFRDITDGTRWFQDILGKGNVNGSADSEIRRRISQTNGVNGIIEYSSNFDFTKRTFSVACTVSTRFGNLTIEESFNG